MRGRRALLLSTTVVTMAWLVTPAVADHHEVKITQVFPGGTGTANLEYVELEMVASGQNLFADSDATVTMLAANGAPNATVELDADLANGQRGRRVLVGSDGTDLTDDVEIAFGQLPDFPFAAGNFLDPAAGAACFEAPQFPGFGDCVSWGAFAASTPFPAGGPAPAIGTDQALDRRRPACGPGVIDTNSPADWTQITPDPFNNGAPAATGTPCPNTTITKKPKKRTTKRRATFKFTATQGVDEFKCKLDSRPFRNCASPFRKRVKPGRHTFKVRATGDSTPASYRWKVVRD